MGADKGLMLLRGKPLVVHVAERLSSVVDEVIIVVSTKEQARNYSVFSFRVVIDAYSSGTPIIGAYTGLAEAKNNYTFISGDDQPLLNPQVVELLFTEAEGHDAATPYWPNGWVEPLHSVYHTRRAAETALQLIESGEKKFRRLLDVLPDVKRVPIEKIRSIDPELRTLVDVNTREELNNLRQLIDKL